ncbi:MAG: flagellar motor switch protein FliM [Candidatus Caldatribacteriaceae bacterium]
MKEILSQEEIDALLKALSSGDIGVEAVEKEQKKETRFKVYDFRRPEKFSKDQIRTFHMIFTTFARLASTSLAGFLRSRLQINLISIDQLTYDEFVRSVPNPTLVGVFSVHPLEGQCVLQIGLDVVFPMIDRLMGGIGEVLPSLRPLTEIEGKIILDVTERIMGAMKESWMNIYNIDPRVETLESNLEFVRVVSGNDMIILFSFEVEVGNKSGMMTICIPYIVIEPISQKLSASLWFASKKVQDPKIQDNIRMRLEKVLLPLRIELGRTKVSMRELLGLEVGDVVVLDRKVEEPLGIFVGKNLKMWGIAGRRGRRLAVRITEIAEED